MTIAHKPGTLRDALDHLVERCGGRKVIASLWGVSAQHVARITAANGEGFPRIDQVMQAETLCGDPIVTRYMASERGCIVEAVRPGPRRPLALVLGNVTSQTGELLSAASLDLAAGKLTKANAGNILHETDDVLCAVVELRNGCRAVQEGDGA